MSDSSANDAAAATRPSQPVGRTVRVPARTAINYWLDLLMGVVFLAFAGVAAILRFVFPMGPDAHQHRLWGRSFDDWRALEFDVLCGFGFLVVVHVTLHWNWVCSVTNTLVRSTAPGRDNGGRTLLGVGILIAVLHLLAGALLYARFSLERLAP